MQHLVSPINISRSMLGMGNDNEVVLVVYMLNFLTCTIHICKILDPDSNFSEKVAVCPVTGFEL